jgi:uncharacterized MAPEG superfamily protein
MLTKTLLIVAETAAINWTLILTASLLRARAWTPSGLRLAFGNRDDMPAPHALAGRTERAARNMLENFVMFAALALVATVGGVTDPRVELGARIFFWARLAYIPIYMVGVPVARTAAWTISVIGMGLILAAIVQAFTG